MDPSTLPPLGRSGVAVCCRRRVYRRFAAATACRCAEMRHLQQRCKYAGELLYAYDEDRDGRIGYDNFSCYMDDAELFQAVDVEHNRCIFQAALYEVLKLHKDMTLRLRDGYYLN